MPSDIVLDQYGNRIVLTPLFGAEKDAIHNDRVHIIGRHHGPCNGEMTIMPISDSHAVLSCNGRCRFAVHVPRTVTSIGALRDYCMHNFGAPRASAAA